MSEPARVFTPIAYALAYAARGWPVFPLHTAIEGGACSCGQDCGNPGKHPRTKNGLKDATTDGAVIKGWWARYPGAGIGIVTGKRSGILVVDIDMKSGGVATWSELVTSHDALPLTVTVKTGGGGSHIYLAMPDAHVKSRAGAIGPGVDIKAEGGYVVAPPSMHASGTRYEHLSGAGPGECEIAACPPWIVELATRGKPKANAFAASSRPLALARGWLAAAFDAAGWLGEQQANGSWKVRCPWAAEHTGGRDGDSSTVVFPPSPGRTLGWFHCSHAHCATRGIADVRASLPEEARSKADAEYPPAWSPPSPGDPTADWQANLPRRPDGSIVPSEDAVLNILANDARWKDVLRFDEFACRVVFRRPPPWHSDYAPSSQPEDWSEEDSTRVVAWLSRAWSLRVGVDVAYRSAMVIAKRNTVDPPRAWLRSLVWDGRVRLPTWCHVYLGAEDTPYHAAVGMRWLISLVARVMRPGCKADCVLILEGEQDVGKSSALAALVPEQWFADDIGDISSKDSADALAGKLILEVGELLAHRRADIEAWKAFTSRTKDHFRPAYARTTIDRPRRCVLGASTNRFDYVTDESGARRNWSVRCGHKIDVKGLAAIRDQLLAEAVVRFDSGEQWWLLESEIPNQRQEVELRRAPDPWTKPIMDWAEEVEVVSIERIMAGPLNIEQRFRTPQDARRIGAILRIAGYERSGQLGTKSVREWIWSKKRKHTCT